MELRMGFLAQRKLIGSVVGGLLLPLLAVGQALAGTAALGMVRVTDVTARSFSVFWTASEAATGNLEVYDDPDGQQLTAEAVIEPNPAGCDAALAGQAADRGLLRVRVSGLAADTPYYYRTVTTTAGNAVTRYPPVGEPPAAVRTEVAIQPALAQGGVLHNDILVGDWTMADGTTAADGTILFGAVPGGDYPITALVGDCAPSGVALLDLNNLFDRSSGRTLFLGDGRAIDLVHFRGPDGTGQVVHYLPVNQRRLEIQPPDPFLRPGWNMFAAQIETNDQTLPGALAGLGGDLASLWQPAADGGWNFFGAGIPAAVNSLTSFAGGQGYWLELAAGAAPRSLLLQGPWNAAGSLPPQPLRGGWNLVAALDIEPVPVADALTGITAQTLSIWTLNPDRPEGWDVYQPGGPAAVNTLAYIEPGRSYWLEMSPLCDTSVNCVW